MGTKQVAVDSYLSILPGVHTEPHWYAIYTSANHEKRVAEQLSLRSIECYLPLYSSVRQWKDRRVTLQLPLFPGYVFVRLALQDQLEVLQIRSVVRLVGSNGSPSILSDVEIQSLQANLTSGSRFEPHPYLRIGRRVQLTSGPMAGMQGILIRRKGKSRLVVSIELIQRSVAVEIGECDVK